jgi:adenosine kinase
MNIIVTGSLAYDRIMDFPGRFREHIIPDKIHVLNVSFNVEKLEENFGGTNGNISYNLKLLGLEPIIVSAAGKDFSRYKEYLEKKRISTEYIAIDHNDNTSVGHIINDLDNNQITSFYLGAYELALAQDIPKKFKPKDSLIIIAPSSKQEIAKRCREAHERAIPYIFDPGQVIPALSPEELAYGAEGSVISLFNDYEWELFRNKTSHELDDLTKKGIIVIVTQGAQGSRIYTKEHEINIGTAKPEQVLDPTGAGDAYRAGIVAGVINKWDWQQAGQLASTIASFAVEKYGTQVHEPSPAEIKKRYQENFNGELPL